MPSKTQHLALLTLTLLTTCSTLIAATHHHAAAPAPAADCNSLVLNMADCLSFVSDGSTDKKPAKQCCSGLKTVLETAPECLCEAFKSSAQMGVTLNVTKALTLPALCGLKAPSGSNCGLSVAVPPAAAPGDFTPSPVGGIAPSSGFNVEAPVPAPSPGSSGSQDLSAPVMSLVIGCVVASFAGF